MMRRTLALATVTSFMLAGAASSGFAAAPPDSMHATHDAKPAAATAAKPAAAEAAPDGSLRAMALRRIADAQTKLISLAEATPADKYSWRPSAGVRTTGEVYMHVAAANYFFPTFWGAKPPAGVDPRGFEKEGADKAKTVATLKASFDYLQQSIGALPDADLGKAIQAFGHSTTPAEMTLIAATHAHEHLGQAIAYARSTGVVPPWSAGQGQGGQ
jgi:uncharacterized damage-inducible protein DinB